MNTGYVTSDLRSRQKRRGPDSRKALVRMHKSTVTTSGSQYGQLPRDIRAAAAEAIRFPLPLKSI
jgi:hypothetical protein